MCPQLLVRLPLLPALLIPALAIASCSDSDGGPQAPAAAIDAGADQAAAVDGSLPETGPEASGDSAQPETSMPPLQEQEPNDGAKIEEHNDLPTGAVLQGAIDKPGDADILHFSAAAGTAYTISLDAPAGSLLQGHLTAMDDGRDGDPAGEDYVKIVRTTAGAVGLDLLAMGQGGYYIVVRDVRNISAASVGGPEYTYAVTVTEADPKGFEAPALQFPVNLQDKLDRAGGLRLYPFTATEGANAVFDLEATGSMDGRMMVFAASAGSWIARNDDRALGDSDPLIDAPLYGSGAMWLVVENVDEAAADWAYTLQGSLK